MPALLCQELPIIVVQCACKPVDDLTVHAILADITQRLEDTPASPTEYLTSHLVDDFLSSASLPKAERSKADIRKWLELFREEFGADPVAKFEERASRGEVNNWRKKWLHSPKQHDMAGTHATRVLNWAVEEGKLKEHHCHKLKKLYQSNRTEIIWTSGDIAQFNKHAPKWVQRILTAGCETGLRAADLVQVKMDQFEETPPGKRLRFRTSKRGQIAYDNMIDGPIVQAKREYAEQMADASGMEYAIIKGTDAEAHNYKFLMA